MAQREDLTLNVKVKGDDDVKKLADSFDDVEDASKRAAQALVADWDKVGVQAKETATIMKTLGDSLGADAGKFDLQRIATEMQQAGVDAKYAAENVEMFADGLRRLDSAKTSVTNLGSGLDTTNTKLDTLRNNSDQTRSVMANLAGNAAQDLGELGGVAGTSGVFIGQLAEYATEGNIALKNLAAAAAPMIGILAAVKLAGNVMQFFGRDAKAAAEEFKTMVEALKEGESALEASNALLAETGELLSPDNIDDSFIRELSEGFLGWEEGAINLNEVLLDMGSTFADWSGAVTGPIESAREFTLQIKAAAEQGHITADQERDLVAALYASRTAWADAGREVDQYNQLTTPAIRSIEELNAALQGQAFLLGAAEHNWGIITEDMADGAIDTQAAADAINILQENLGLTSDEMDELVAKKTDEYMLDVAAAEEEAAAEALRLNQAVADLGDTMASIDSDDFANISGALEGELNKLDDIYAGLKFDVDFQPALDEALDGLESFGPDLQTLADEWANILAGKPIDIFGNVRADDAAFQAKMGELTDLFQEGVVNAFDQGGVEAANTFVQSTAAQIAASTGLDIAEVYRIMGLPPDGSVDALIKPSVDAEATADALAILDGLIGVDPNNPILAYMRLGVQTGDIPPQIAEIAARILAGEALGVPAKLEEFTQADIDAAYALIAQQEVTVPTAVDPSGAEDGISDIEDGDYQATIDALADTQLAARQLLDETTRQRQATIYAIASIASAKAALDSLRERRTASILAVAYTAGAEYELNHTARRRDSYIYQHVVPVGGGVGGDGDIPGAGTLAAPTVGPALMTAPMTTDGEIVGTPSPMSVPSSGVAVVSTAPSSITNNMQVTVQAAVIGNRHEVERTVAKALRSYTRLNGSRN